MSWRWPSQNTFGMCTVLYWTLSSRTQFSMSINVWRLAGDTLNITCNFLYCNHQVHRDFLIILYKVRNHQSLSYSDYVWCQITHYRVISKASLLIIKAPECEAVPLFLTHFEVHNVWNFGSTSQQIFTVHISSTRIALFLPNTIAQLLTILSFRFQDWLSSLCLTCFFSIFPGKLGFNNFKISLQCFFP
jgi:hypothetical protein